MFRNRGWFGGVWNRPTNRLSLEHLKYLHSNLEKTLTSDTNCTLLVESLRCIAEILIWGDQYDSSVFDFFLEKNMLCYFLQIMRQKGAGSNFVCVQLLQTLNILFENIRNETSLYYLLSNNNVNSIIAHGFDFTDEDLLCYYILFLKTLSLKLNANTIHFFYNEHTSDFPLYTEAIKFFNHPESMVRIAVRTISLNVYKVQNENMLQFITDNRSANAFFCNLVCYTQQHIKELDDVLRTDLNCSQTGRKLTSLIAELVNHLYYLNDIFLLQIGSFNAILTQQLLDQILIPLCIFSMSSTTIPKVNDTQAATDSIEQSTDFGVEEKRSLSVSSTVALYLFSLVFLIITHPPLIRPLAWIILKANKNFLVEILQETRESFRQRQSSGLVSLTERLEESRANTSSSSDETPRTSASDDTPRTSVTNGVLNTYESSVLRLKLVEKCTMNERKKETSNPKKVSLVGKQRPILDTVLNSLDCQETDYEALFGLCLVYAMVNNPGISVVWMNEALIGYGKFQQDYKTVLVGSLLNIISLANQPTYQIRLVTLKLALNLLPVFTKNETEECNTTECQQRALFLAQHQATLTLRHFYETLKISPDLFDDEYNQIQKSHFSAEFLFEDSAIFMPAQKSSSLEAASFRQESKTDDPDQLRRAIRVFLLLRRTCQIIFNETETMLPLVDPTVCIKPSNVLNLSNYDMIACVVEKDDQTKMRGFMVINASQLIVVEPDGLLGWGVAKIVCCLEDVEVDGVRGDSRCLHVTAHKKGAASNQTPLLSADFIFDDHIRCMAAKQQLTKARNKVRRRKMQRIAEILGIPDQDKEFTGQAVPSPQSKNSSKSIQSQVPKRQPVPGFVRLVETDEGSSASTKHLHINEDQSQEST